MTEIKVTIKSTGAEIGKATKVSELVKITLPYVNDPSDLEFQNTDDNSVISYDEAYDLLAKQQNG